MVASYGETAKRLPSAPRRQSDVASMAAGRDVQDLLAAAHTDGHLRSPTRWPVEREMGTTTARLAGAPGQTPYVMGFQVTPDPGHAVAPAAAGTLCQ